ncbi:MAG: type I-U CRISPR-associated protein Cas5/Cas6 [Bryobacteraceae bacterium]|nr:type I-U CRISPR-associated protein Cas5/Cas6 [Bryobacteraceae bacterium]
MIRLLFEFSAGRYHATPWGHHVNEGLVEWPPSPWRIIRALLATGYTKLGWQDVPDDMRRLVEAFAAHEPVYRLPRATTGHTRHYMPVRGLKKNGVQNTSNVIDAFVIPDGPLVVEWPVSDNSFPRNLLEELLDRLGYLGRAESRVRARLAGENESLPDLVVSTRRRGVDDDPVRLLAPVSAAAYTDWRRRSQDGPEDLLAALQIDTRTLQNEGWNIPPGARESVYWRPAHALAHVFGAESSYDTRTDRSDTALFALSTDKKRDVLPLMERALPTMALFRRALLSRIGDEQQLGTCPELTGKDREGRPLRCKHQHAHFIPLSLDSQAPRRIDHVLVYAPMGFGPLAERGLRRLRRTWAKGMDDIAVTLIGIGKRGAFRSLGGKPVPELGSSTTWVSRTPFIPPRFLKPRGKDSIEGQVRAELLRRELPDLAVPPVIAAPTNDNVAGRQARWFRRFVRTRQGNGGTPPGGLFHLTLTFDRPVEGPLCLGWGSHFGLGLFVPANEGCDA